jgi:hypothetical protein
MAPEYQKSLSSILNETDSEVVMNYFVWKAVQSFSGYVDADEVKPYRRFVNELAGKVGSTIYKDCLIYALTSRRTLTPHLNGGASV